MNRYSKAATSSQYVYVKLKLTPGMVYFAPVEMHFLYDSKSKCVRYSMDGLACHETVVTDFHEHVNIEEMFTDSPAQFYITDVPIFIFHVKSGDKMIRIAFEYLNEILEYHKSYKWIVTLFEKICEKDQLIKYQ
ncbi:MAG: hypothetical protein IKP91_04510 [Bacteroidaceae bacterium]|nr:hypothetical protein [Bacteroidaceae bacterium]